MAFFGALGRFFRRVFGLGEGAVNNASDKILTASEATIRAQFRKVRDKLQKNHDSVKNAVAGLMAMVETRKQDITQLEKTIKELETKKLGAVKKFKETNDMKYRDAFKNCHTRLERALEKLETDKAFVKENTENIERYKRQLLTFKAKIEDLKGREDQAVADIISSRQVTKLNDTLAGFSTDFDLQGLEVIEKARKTAIANAKLSSELSATSKQELEDELLDAGSEVDDEFTRLLADEEKTMLDQNQERTL